MPDRDQRVHGDWDADIRRAFEGAPGIGKKVLIEIEGWIGEYGLHWGPSQRE